MSSTWPRVPLSELVTQRRDAVKLEDNVEYRLLGVRWYGEGAFHRETVTRDSSKATTVYRVSPGQFIYNRLFAGKGSFGVIPPEFADSFVSNEFPLFDTNLKRLSVEYLYLHFQQKSIWDYVDSVSTGTTASRSRWKESQFLAHRIPLPPLSIQNRIVDIFKAVDDHVDALSTEAKALVGVYRGFLLSLGERSGEVKIGEVVAQAFAGGTPSRSQTEFYGGDIPWLKSGEVDSDHIVTAAEFITKEGLKGSSAKMVPSGATVVAMYGQGDTKGKAGFVEASICTNQAVLALIPDEAFVLPRFLLHAVRSKTDELRRRAVGSSQPNLSKSLVLTQTIPMPNSLADQERALSVIDSVRANQALLHAEAVRLREVRAALLSKLLERTIEIESVELGV